MQPPIFVWKSGTLDMCDTLGELNVRYPPGELAQEDVVVCDSHGQAIWISRATGGVWVNAADESQPSSPDLLRSILWRYLEGRGTPPEEIESLSLSELVEEVCPPDPYPAEEKVKGRILGELFIAAVILLCIALSMLIEWLRGNH
jgi:hypothetical protein